MSDKIIDPYDALQTVPVSSPEFVVLVKNLYPDPEKMNDFEPETVSEMVLAFHTAIVNRAVNEVGFFTALSGILPTCHTFLLLYGNAKRNREGKVDGSNELGAFLLKHVADCNGCRWHAAECENEAARPQAHHHSRRRGR